MIPILSVTSVKDYVEIVHKLIESDSSYKITIMTIWSHYYLYNNVKRVFSGMLCLNWLKSIWDLPIIIPDISSHDFRNFSLRWLFP
jgi:hypothetical protein